MDTEDISGAHAGCKKRQIALFAVCKWGIIISSRIKPAAYLFAAATSQIPDRPGTVAAACNPGMCLLALPVVSAGEIKEEVLCYESEC